MKNKALKNYPTKSLNCANCKRAKSGKWVYGLYFCVCKKGELIDSSNPEHYDNCPFYKEYKNERKSKVQKLHI